jgi:hypothetical protein
MKKFLVEHGNTRSTRALASTAAYAAATLLDHTKLRTQCSLQLSLTLYVLFWRGFWRICSFEIYLVQTHGWHSETGFEWSNGLALRLHWIARATKLILVCVKGKSSTHDRCCIDYKSLMLN